MTTTGGPSATTGKFGATKGNASKREVEQNPFKTLLDISDLIEMEVQTAVSGPKEVEKEVQNIMLRNNSDLKAWYKLYARKVEAQKSEESFSMTLRQVWRFMRDCQIIGPDCTLAQFDRVFNQGRKNHFALKPKQVQDAKLPSLPSTGRKKEYVKVRIGQPGVESSGDEDEEELVITTTVESTEVEDIHLPAK